MPVVGLEIKYFKTLFHGEEVVIDSWAMSRKGIRWPWISKVYRSNGDLIIEAKVDLVLVRLSDTKRNLLRETPEDLLAVFSSLHQGPIDD